MTKAVFAGLLLSLLLSCAATAQTPPCGPVEQLKAQMLQRYDETPRGEGVRHDGTLLQIYRSDDGSTWTLMAVRGDGLACIVAAGRSWEDIVAPLPGEAM